MSAIASMILKKDVLCFYALNRRFHCRALDLAMRSLTQLGSTAAAVMISIFLLLYNKNMGITLLINLLSSQFIIHLIKRIVDRPRPYKTLEWAVAINPPKCRYSLPSGHSGSALSIGITLASFFPALRIALFVIAFLVGISRVYLGVHYPTDVTLGFAIAIITYEVFIRMDFTSFIA
jgi:undecaprenyl-diphosphatase